MKNKTHEILSAIHHILSLASAEELRAAASEETSSRGIREALEVLSKELAETPSRRPLKYLPEPSNSTDVKKKRRNIGLPSSSDALHTELIKSLEGFKKNEVLDLSKELGLSISANRKDSLERIGSSTFVMGNNCCVGGNGPAG